MSGVGLAPNLVEAHSALANYLFDEGEDDKAEKAARNLLERFPNHQETLELLGDLGLAYVIKDGSIQVTTPLRAKETLTTRTYYLGDLVSYTDTRLGPVLTQALLLKTGREIVEMIKGSVDPSTWRENGGEGTIAFDPRTLSIVVKQSAEVHSILGSSYK